MFLARDLDFQALYQPARSEPLGRYCYRRLVLTCSPNIRPLPISPRLGHRLNGHGVDRPERPQSLAIGPQTWNLPSQCTAPQIVLCSEGMSLSTPDLFRLGPIPRRLCHRAGAMSPLFKSTTVETSGRAKPPSKVLSIATCARNSHASKPSAHSKKATCACTNSSNRCRR